MSIAERLLVKQTANAKELARLDAALQAVRITLKTVMALAETMAAAVRRHGLASRKGVLASIDECLMAAFEHCGDSIDIEHELIEVQSGEPNLDKWPGWIDGAPVALKTTVGKVMAREGIPSTARWSLSDRGHQTLLQFILDNGEHTEGWLLDMPFPFRDPLASVRMHMENQRRHAERLERQLAEVDRINRENRERQEKMLRHASAHLPTMPSVPGLPVATSHRASNNVGPRPNGLGEPIGRRVPELLSSNRSGSIPSALVGAGSLSLPAKTRHYMSGLGRFLTAARLQEQLQGEHPYGYALNNPVTYTDPSGLSPMMCADDCDKACDNFIAANPKWCAVPPSPPYPPGSKAWAFAFCCNGKPYTCYCPGQSPSPNPYIRACVNVHESGHIPPGGCASGYTGPPPKWNDECTALKAGIKCANEQCRNTISNDCIELEEWRCKECRRLKYACKPMPPETWLRQFCKGCGVS